MICYDVPLMIDLGGKSRFQSFSGKNPQKAFRAFRKRSLDPLE
jgi:hypothetical protein